MLVGYTNEINSEMAQMQRQLALMVKKDVDNVIRDLAIMKGD